MWTEFVFHCTNNTPVFVRLHEVTGEALEVYWLSACQVPNPDHTTLFVYNLDGQTHFMTPDVGLVYIQKVTRLEPHEQVRFDRLRRCRPSQTTLVQEEVWP